MSDPTYYLNYSTTKKKKKREQEKQSTLNV